MWPEDLNMKIGGVEEGEFEKCLATLTILYNSPLSHNSTWYGMYSVALMTLKLIYSHYTASMVQYTLLQPLLYWLLLEHWSPYQWF